MVLEYPAGGVRKPGRSTGHYCGRLITSNVHDGGASIRADGGRATESVGPLKIPLDYVPNENSTKGAASLLLLARYSTPPSSALRANALCVSRTFA